MTSSRIWVLGLSIALAACATSQGRKLQTREATLAGDILAASADASGMTAAAVAVREALCGPRASKRALCNFRRHGGPARAPITPATAEPEAVDATESLPEPTVEYAEPAEPPPPASPGRTHRAPAARPLALGDVRFGFDSTRLGALARRSLEQATAELASDPDAPVRIEGHADSIGAEDYNRSLSERRARAIAFWLAAHGVPRSRLHPVGLGEAHPVADNRSERGRALNRRAELTLLQ